jgi:hypothetical protein
MKSFTLNLVRRILLGAMILTTAGFGLAGSNVQACDNAPVYRYEWVVRYETRQVAYTVCETRIDHCGRAYTVEVTRYRTVQVPVQYRIVVRVS